MTADFPPDISSRSRRCCVDQRLIPSLTTGTSSTTTTHNTTWYAIAATPTSRVQTSTPWLPTTTPLGGPTPSSHETPAYLRQAPQTTHSLLNFYNSSLSNIHTCCFHVFVPLDRNMFLPFGD